MDMSERPRKEARLTVSLGEQDHQTLRQIALSKDVFCRVSSSKPSDNSSSARPTLIIRAPRLFFLKIGSEA